MDRLGECQEFATLIVGSYKVVIGSLLQILLGIVCPDDVNGLTVLRTRRCGKDNIPGCTWYCLPLDRDGCSLVLLALQLKTVERSAC